MTVSQKAALSLLITVVLFAGFTVLAFTGLFDLLESRFYNPSIVSSLTREVNADARVVDNYFIELENRFSLTLQESSVRRSFLPNQSAEDIFERSRIYGLLMESLGGFQGVRFIDNGGTRIHYSTYPADILRQDRLSVAYHNYADSDLAYSQVASSDQAGLKLIFDENGNRILFSLPFYDSFDVFRGTALFSLSVRAIADRLAGEGRIKAGENISIVSEPVGIVLGMPLIAENALILDISSVWNEGILSLTSMDSVSGTSLALLSTKTSHGFFLGSLINENRFVFPQLMKIILLGAFFLTVYLTIFLLFNLRQDSLTIVQNRLKQLQISLIEQYYDRKSDIDWGHWSRELEQRREEIRSELKQGIKTNKDEKNDIDVLIDKSWNELLTVISGRRDKASLIDEEKLQAILNRVLSAGASIPAPAAAAVPAKVSAAAEEVEELADAEAVEELSEAGPVEEVEELSEVEPVEEMEELEEAEPVEEVEEIEEISPMEEAVIPEIGDMELAGPEIGKIMAPKEEEGEPMELEELDELDEIEISETGKAGEPEKVKELDNQPDEHTSSSGLPGMTDLDLANLASQIEFSSNLSKEEEDTALEKDLEIVSPFATMLSDFSHAGDTDSGIAAKPSLQEAVEISSKTEPSDDTKEGEKKKPVEEEKTTTKAKRSESGLETLNVQHGMSLMYKPFLYMDFSDPQDLKSPSDDPEEKPFETGAPKEEYDVGIIEEHEGVHYINQEILTPSPQIEKDLNLDFKNLVNSVIKSTTSP